jgi:catechol-2,3-dioxygenase
MLAKSMLYPTLPVVDLKRARKFYEGMLGLEVMMAGENGLTLQVGDCRMYLYKRGPTKADHTVVAFEGENIESKVKELKNKGLKFEEYDIPAMHLKTVNSIASMRDSKSSWFKDTEGNILSIVQMDKAKMKSMKQMAGSSSARDEAFNY